MDEMDELVKEFLVESYDNLDSLDRDFVSLEQDPTDKDMLAQIFRYIHTIKGTCGFLAFGKLEKVSHVGENLLSKLRDGDLTLNPAMTDALLEMVDAIREILGNIEVDGKEGDTDYSALVSALEQHLKGETPAAPPAPTVDTAEPAPALEEDVAVEAPASDEERPSWMASDDVIAEAEAMFAALDAAKEDPPAPEAPAEEAPEAIKEATPKPAAEPVAAVAAAEAKDAPQQSASVAETSIRVDVKILDKLMNLVGELVLARNQILQQSYVSDDPAFTATIQRLNLVSSELQEGVMKTRMQPIGNVWSKFPRVVRDLSQSLDKKIRLEMEGRDTELDKTLLEAIKDPLTHIVRNSVDHGIEMPEARVAKGKPEEGILLLRAYHEGGQVNIEIIDDGAGLDPEKLKAKALERGVITAEQAPKMSDREVTNLIFAAGFSTAEKVTNVSGRGVGMDVVRTNIEKIGGSVDIQSELGKGTTLRIRIPLTLAIIPALIVSCEGDRYPIPQISLLELVRLKGDQLSQIESIHGTPVYRLRGNLLPLVYLAEQLCLGDECPNQTTQDVEALNEKAKENARAHHEEPENGKSIADDEVERSVNIVVLQADERPFGLVVDSVQDTEEIVVKPLSKQLKDIETFAGAAIMGDGRVSLILDVKGIAHRAGVIGDQSDHGVMDADLKGSDQAEEKTNVLLFRSDVGGRMAIDLSLVSRLEEFSSDQVEGAGDLKVIQYRGHILPLVNVSETLEERRTKPRTDESNGEIHESEQIQVVVYTTNGRSVGLVVDQIVDITEETLSTKGHASRDGVLFSSVIQGSVTEFLDIDHIIKKAIPDFYDRTVTVAAEV
jgi:two-component system chemotaxis sensor kinase CheA